jgi:hypothetical protein
MLAADGSGRNWDEMGEREMQEGGDAETRRHGDAEIRGHGAYASSQGRRSSNSHCRQLNPAEPEPKREGLITKSRKNEITKMDCMKNQSFGFLSCLRPFVMFFARKCMNLRCKVLRPNKAFSSINQRLGPMFGGPHDFPRRRHSSNRRVP